jgi:hypothetical protein
MAAIKLTHEEGISCKVSHLESWEQDALGGWLLYHLSMEQRHDLMANLPGVYSKMVGIKMQVIVGKEPGEL